MMIIQFKLEPESIILIVLKIQKWIKVRRQNSFTVIFCAKRLGDRNLIPVQKTRRKLVPLC